MGRRSAGRSVPISGDGSATLWQFPTAIPTSPASPSPTTSSTSGRSMASSTRLAPTTAASWRACRRAGSSAAQRSPAGELYLGTGDMLASLFDPFSAAGPVRSSRSASTRTPPTYVRQRASCAPRSPGGRSTPRSARFSIRSGNGKAAVQCARPRANYPPVPKTCPQGFLAREVSRNGLHSTTFGPQPWPQNTTPSVLGRCSDMAGDNV